MRGLTVGEMAAKIGRRERTVRDRAALPPDHPLHIHRGRDGLYYPGGPPGETSSRAEGVEARHRASGRGHAEERILDELAGDAPGLLGLLADGGENGEETDEEFLRRRIEATERHARTHAPKRFTIRRNGPFGVTYIGDPHGDDDGCDLRGLVDDIKKIRDTDHLYAVCVGDLWNNWVGRLEGKYRDQTSTEREAFRTVRIILLALAGKWDAVIEGNHDLWKQGALLLEELARQADLRRMAPHEAEVTYDCGNGVQIGTVIRHYFPGHSMWHPTHGALRWAKMRSNALVFVQGHIHEWGEIRFEGTEHDAKLCMVVRGYKKIDEYAESKGYQNHEHGRSCTVIFNPDARHPHEVAHAFHDIDLAADYLRFLRARA